MAGAVLSIDQGAICAAVSGAPDLARLILGAGFRQKVGCTSWVR